MRVLPPTARAISPSRADALNCPFRYREVYHRDVREPVAQEKLVGGLVHEVASLYYNAVAAEKIEHGSRELLDRMVDKVWTERRPEITPQCHEPFVELALGFEHRIFDPQAIAATELALAFDENWKPVPTDLPERHRYRGVLDLVAVVEEQGERIIHVTDWTSAGLGATMEAKKDQQLRFYGLLCYHEYGIESVRVTVDSLRTGMTKTVRLGLEDHDRTRRWAEGELKRLEALDPEDDACWPAIPGHLCGDCYVDCPLLKHKLIVPPRISDTSEAEAMLKWGVVLDETAGKIKKLLKGWVAFHGPVASNGMIAEARTSQSYDFPFQETRDLLCELGYDPDEIGNLSRETVQKCIRREHREAVMAMAKVSHTERFGLYKERAKE